MAKAFQLSLHPNYKWLTVEPDSAPDSRLLAAWDARPQLCGHENGFVYREQDGSFHFGDLLPSHLFALPTARTKHAVWERDGDRWVRAKLKDYR